MTYRRKPDTEIERLQAARQRQGLSPLPPLWISAASAFLIFLFLSHFPVRFSAPLGFSLKSMWVALASGLGIFGFLYAMQIFTRHVTSDEPRVEICRVCHRPARQGEQRCPCGGEFEPAEYYEPADE